MEQQKQESLGSDSAADLHLSLENLFEKATRELASVSNPTNLPKEPVQTGDNSLSAPEFLKLQEELEKEAARILPGKFDLCTFDKGYISQPLYACLTCSKIKSSSNHQNPLQNNSDIFSSIIKEGLSKKTQDPSGTLNLQPTLERNLQQSSWNSRISDTFTEKPSDPNTKPPNFEPAGICYSCSISCHSKHDVVELFSKRNFKCDCGTTKLLHNAPCSLKPNNIQVKSTTNKNNNYNHNFWGYYCRCDTFYDPESETREMIQCFSCNDWFHDSCIGLVPGDDDYDEYICRSCVSKCSVLAKMSSINVFKGIIDKNTSKVVDIVQTRIQTNSVIVDADLGEQDHTDNKNVESYKIVSGGEDTETSLDVCKLSDEGIIDEFDMFVCKNEIQNLGLEFLYNENNVFVPEVDETRSESLYEAGIKELGRMDRSQALEGSVAYREFYDNIKTFLTPFAENKRTVEAQDIASFFDGISSKKHKHS
ncbi:hypothetical protein BB558_003670 [Smittium angustum]|uniref:PHD-type domain-containing protein n=1 Tax=Smittium angustum TaxID=133377 RepID=A0A2U1J5C1_SMIAN|nr:hypothetical protein BB558_003670 [Smittium angustum]